jgi:transglutaminase-like putative cysteine protease
MPTPISFGMISGGTLGAMQTLQKMRSLVNQGVKDPLVIETARRLVATLPPRDFDSQARAIRAYLVEHFQFTQDPRGLELLATPRYLLTQVAKRYVVQGDCDDAAILGCALAKAIGLRCRFVILAFHYPDAPFAHVFGVVKGRSRWFDLDTTRPVRMVEPTVTRTYDVEV